MWAASESLLARMMNNPPGSLEPIEMAAQVELAERRQTVGPVRQLGDLLGAAPRRCEVIGRVFVQQQHVRVAWGDYVLLRAPEREPDCQNQHGRGGEPDRRT